MISESWVMERERGERERSGKGVKRNFTKGNTNRKIIDKNLFY